MNSEPPPELSGLGDEDVKRLQDVLTNLINHMAVRIQYAETRRNTFAVVGGTLAAGGIALITLAFSQIAYPPLLIATVAFGLSAITTGIVTWIVYARQTNFPYPFLRSKAGIKSDKWFYHNALANTADFDATTFGRLRKEHERRGKDGFEEQWTDYLNKQLAVMPHSRSNAYDDLKQSYLLHVNERYKNLFLTHLRKVIYRGLFLSCVIAVAGFTLTLCFLSPNNLMAKSHETDVAKVSSSWEVFRRLQANATVPIEDQVLFNCVIQNKSDSSLILTTVVARHKNGMQIPFSVHSFSPMPVRIPPQGFVAIEGLLSVPSGLGKHIDNFELH